MISGQSNEDRGVTVRRGFFWAHPESNEPSISGLRPGDVVTRCVFMARPKWWQVRRWSRVVRLWLTT